MLRKDIDAKILDYFNKKLMLRDEGSYMDKADMLSHDDTMPDDDTHLEAEITSPVFPESDGYSANAYKLLNYFPIDKSQFSDPEIMPKERNLFSGQGDIDREVNALLFSTRLLFLDSTPIKTKQLLSVVAHDSYGYMNIIRKNQIDLLKVEIGTIEKIFEKTNSSFIQKTIRQFNKVRLEQRKLDSNYLNFMIDFYAKNVLNPDMSMSERREMIEDWLGKKIEKEFN